MTITLPMRRTRIWSRRDIDATHALAAAVILMAVEDAQAADPDALAFLHGEGTAPFWFDIVCPESRDPDDVRRMVLAMAGMEQAA